MQPQPSGQTPPVAWSTTEAFHADYSRYAHSRELAHALRSIRYCKVETFRGCALGTIHIPPKEANGPSLSFGFYETEEGLTLFEDDGRLQRWLDKRPALFDDPHPGEPLLLVLQGLIEDDIFFLSRFEKELEALEDTLLHCLPAGFFLTLTTHRRRLSALNAYYEQLTNLGEQMQAQVRPRENAEAWANFARRTELLQNHVRLLRENIVQLRELYHAQQDAKQNRVIMVLTVVTTLFLPLTLLTGWYGMNFRYMPELHWAYGYPAVIFIAACSIALEILYFKKKKFF